MHWSEAVSRLRRTGRAGVLVTVAQVRGHAPRNGGAKMVVADDEQWGSIGGGNLEFVAAREARRWLIEGLPEHPQLLTDRLNSHEPGKVAQQCCGGEVTVLLEPLPALPTVALIGVGHVGLEVARQFARLEVNLVLVDSRPEMLAPERLAPLGEPAGSLTARHLMTPEAVLDELPPGAEVLVMTHDHAEDIAVLDAALRRERLGWIGVIGSSAKWTNFQGQLARAGFTAADIARITCPIGLPGISGKEPAVIAVSVAADFLRRRSERPAAESTPGTDAAAG